MRLTLKGQSGLGWLASLLADYILLFIALPTYLLACLIVLASWLACWLAG